jgi:hypothetical protein
MPTISQLPAATAVNATDEVPISQSGSVVAATIAQILASTQPAITLPGMASWGIFLPCRARRFRSASARA